MTRSYRYRVPFRVSLAALRPAALALCLLAGCSVIETPAQPRGHRVEQDLLKELTPGTSTKADVVALLGTPTKRASFDDNVWIYISSVTRLQIARKPGIDSQDITVLTFTPQGTLKEIERLSKDDALPVDVVGRETPSPGADMTFLQQLLGNVGRLNPGVSGAAGKGGGGGAPGGGGPGR